jgi:hypothetical protein
MNGAQLFKVQGDSSELMNGPPAGRPGITPDLALRAVPYPFAFFLAKGWETTTLDADSLTC